MGYFSGDAVMDGFNVCAPTAQPSYDLPSDVAGKTIAIRCSAGIGDMLISVGTLAKRLSASGAVVHAAVVDSQVDLAQELQGVTLAVRSTCLNDRAARSKYDCLLELSNFLLADSRTLVAKDYFIAASDAVGLEPRPVVGTFKSIRWIAYPAAVVAIHASASTPLRRWSEPSWESVGTALVRRGLRCLWLGTQSDFSMHGEGHTKAADIVGEGLLEQVDMLSHCSYFIGNDSGFAHVAGMLGIPGLVLFSITEPEHVIKHYPTLRDIKGYALAGVEPSRSLRNDDPNATISMAAIKPSMVLAKVPLVGGVSPYYAQCPLTGRLPRVLVAGPYKGCEDLQKWFNVASAESPISGELAEDYDAIVVTARDWIWEDCQPCGTIPLIEAPGEAPESIRSRVRGAMGQTWPEAVRKGVIKIVPYPALGDVILASSLIPKVRETFPEAKICFPVRHYFRDCFQGLGVELDDLDADLVLRAFYYDCWRDGLTALEKIGGNEWEMQLGNLPICDRPPRGLVGFVPRQGGNPNKVKEWGDDNWRQLAEGLEAHGYVCCQLGTTLDAMVEGLVDLRQPTVDKYLATLAEVEHIITIEGAAQHALRAMGKRATVLWGKSATPELIGYKFHNNIITKTPGKCVASIDPSTFNELECCGGVCMAGLEVREVLKEFT